MNFMMIAVAVLGAIGLVAALVLYVCSKKFAVYEDPRISQVAALLPGVAALPDVVPWPMLWSKVLMQEVSTASAVPLVDRK